jgi:hypothetical protein
LQLNSQSDGAAFIVEVFRPPQHGLFCRSEFLREEAVLEASAGSSASESAWSALLREEA